MSIIDYAFAYQKKGWIIHPLSSPKAVDKKTKEPLKTAGKAVLIKNWQDKEAVTQEEITLWFSNIDLYFKDCNIGIQCGRRSGVTVLDFDSELFKDYIFHGIELNTLVSGRINGRGHVFFKYSAALKSQKHHDLGIEVLSDGGNAVLPPSIHKSGDIYKWADADAPVMVLPDLVLQRLNTLFRTETELKQIIAKCRHCFRDVLKIEHNMHGADGREYMLAICADLKAGGATEDHAKMFARLMYQKDYKEAETLREWQNIDPAKTWTCEKLKERLPAYLDLTLCEKCEVRRQKYKDAKEGKNKSIIKAPIELPPIPHEPIDSTPITVLEVVAGFKENIHFDEDLNITIPLNFGICNFAPVDSDVMVVVGPSGSGKTEGIRALGDTENQYAYPLSSMTSHTLVSGLKDARDLAPQLRSRLLTCKDFTTILSKNKDEVAGIFADIRDISDGYIQKIYGSEVSKKEYRGIHTSILLGCTNAIERYYSVNSILGQRMVYFRPQTDPIEARKKAMKNAGKEKEIREIHHNLVMRLFRTVLTEKKERIRNLTQGIPEDMKERIGKLCDFLAIVRTHIDRDFKGDMASIPEPELPTRLTKTLCKLVDGHSILYDRLPTYEDEGIAVRLVHDNIPTERLQILKILSCYDEQKKTSEIATAAKLPTSMVNRVLNDLAALNLIDRIGRNEIQSNSDEWILPEGVFKNAFLIVMHYKIWFIDSEMLKGVIRVRGYADDQLDTYKRVYQNLFNKYNNEYIKKIIIALHTHLSELHPSTSQDAAAQFKNQFRENEQKTKQPVTELTAQLEAYGRFYESQYGSINSTNLTAFTLEFCRLNKPVYTETSGAVYPYTSSMIEPLAAMLFKITPPSAGGKT